MLAFELCVNDYILEKIKKEQLNLFSLYSMFLINTREVPGTWVWFVKRYFMENRCFICHFCLPEYFMFNMDCTC